MKTSFTAPSFEVSHADFEGEGFHQVYLETPRGERFLHNYALDSFKAEALAKKVKAAVDAKGLEALNMDHWMESDFPRYGSDAFLEQEAEAFAAANLVRSGHASEADMPTHIRTLL